MSENKTSRNTRDYEIGRGKPPVHSRFKKGQLGNPRGPRPKNLPALPIEALNERVVVTIDGERRVGGVLTGCGAEMIIIDDPFCNRIAAVKPLYPFRQRLTLNFGFRL